MTNKEKAAMKALIEAKALVAADLAAKKEEKAAGIKARKEAAQAKREAREAAKAKAKAIRDSRIRQNGILLPLEGSKAFAAWACFDDLTEMNEAPAKLGEAMALGEMRKLHPGNIKAEYSAWRKFHGHAAQGK